MTIGYDKPLYVLPFDHRATFSKNMFGWQGQLTSSLLRTSQLPCFKAGWYPVLSAPARIRGWILDLLRQSEIGRAVRRPAGDADAAPVLSMRRLPQSARTTRPQWISSSTTRRAVLAGMASPTPELCPARPAAA